MRPIVAALTLTLASTAHAASVQAVYPFVDTGPATPSNYAHGNTPIAELLQASDGNFYGTTVYGGAGLCPNGHGGDSGCGTIFRITAQGVETVLYSFPFDTSTNSAPDGAFPTAGLIQGEDGSLYGVAQDGASQAATAPMAAAPCSASPPAAPSRCCTNSAAMACAPKTIAAPSPADP